MKIDRSELSTRVWAMDERRLRTLIASIPVEVSAGPLEMYAAAQARKQRDAAGYSVSGGVARIAVKGVILKTVPWYFEWLGIDGVSTDALAEQVKAAAGDLEVNAIRYDIDSPGGTVDGVQELASTIRTASTIKPSSASVSNIAASAAYWLAAQAQHIDANPAAEVGSIGVYTVVDDLSKAYESEGIKTHVVSSHPLKGAGVEGAPVTDDQLADIKRMIDGYAALFVDDVARGRAAKMCHEDVAGYATGQTWLAADALKAGLIDAVRGDAAVSVAVEANAPAQGAQPAAVAAAAQAAEVSEMTEQEMKAENERIRADAAKAKADADAKIAQLVASQRKALLDKYADHFSPANRPAMESMAEKFAEDFAGLEATLVAMPKITRPERASAEIAEVGAEAQTVPGGPMTLAEHELCKYTGSSVDRLRDMQAVGEAVDHVEFRLEQDADGKTVRKPLAVLKDGRRLTKAELTKALGLKGAVVGLLFALSLVFGGTANATGAAAATATQCKNSGITKAYLMEASETIYAGEFVMIDSGGEAVSAEAEASNHNIAGVAQETKTSGASGSYYIKVSDGVICKFAGTTLEQDDVGKIVYAEDSLTVDETVGSNEPVAGVLVEYVSASVGWVYVSSLVNFGRVAVTSPLTLTDTLTLSEAATISQPANGTVSITEASEDLDLVFSSNALTLASDGGIVSIDLGALSTTLTLANGQTIVSDENEVVKIGDSEDIEFGFGTGNTVILTSDSGVVAFDFAAVGTTITLANDQTITSDEDNYIKFGDASEDIELGFATGNTVDFTSDSGVVVLDFAAVGTTLQLANDQVIVSDEDNVIKLGDAEDIELDFSVNNTLTLSSDSGVTKVDFVSMNIETDGTFQVLGSGATIGWTIASGANTACATTCAGTGACVVGFDAGASVFALCSDAAADTCVCAGPAS